MWSACCNDDGAINPFATIVEKDAVTKGNFATDFQSLCTSYCLISCPNIKAQSLPNEGEKLMIQNVEIDLSNWRASLLSSVTIGSKVSGIYVHRCLLTPQHIIDLASALTKSGKITTVVLQYLTLNVNEESVAAWIEAFKTLFAEATQVECFSLRGCNLGNAVVVGFLSALSNNLRLKSLSLAQNGLTEESVTALLQSLRFNHIFQAVSFAGNSLSSSSCISPFVELVTGTSTTATDEATIKALIKTLGDKNKAVKEANKKRKKAGLPEFEEFPPLPEFIKSVDGAKLFINPTLRFADFAGNALNFVDNVVGLFNGINTELLIESGFKIGFGNLDLNNEQLQPYQDILITSS